MNDSLRLKGETHDYEKVIFNITDIDDDVLVFVDGLEWKIDPTTIQLANDPSKQSGTRVKCDHCGQCFDTDIVGVHAHCDNCGEAVKVGIKDQPKDVILADLKAAHAFIDVMLSFYGTNLEVANWHMNGDLQSCDSFFDDNMRGDELELLSAAIKKAEGTELISGRVEAVEYPREEKSIEVTIISRQWIDRMMEDEL